MRSRVRFAEAVRTRNIPRAPSRRAERDTNHDGAEPLISEDDIRKLSPVLYRFALRATRDVEASRDLAQEALLAAVSQCDSFAERSSLRTWVVGILAHKITDHVRRAAVRGAGRFEGEDDPELVATPSAEDVERVVIARQELTAVDRALGQLPDRERLALLLVDVEGTDRDEACNALGVGATHLRVLLHRGRNRLRRILEETPHVVR
jgi:RNA polymerase sigma factor (sigma-70 family)